MCRYCEFNSFGDELLEDNNSNTPGSTMYINKYDGKSFITVENSSFVNEIGEDFLAESIDIKYCPMCGRKLQCTLSAIIFIIRMKFLKLYVFFCQTAKSMLLLNQLIKIASITAAI